MGCGLGAGGDMAMNAEIIVAGEGAKFGQPEGRFGIIPGSGGTQRLTRIGGKFQAMKICLTGEFVSARDALAMGLVSEVVPDDAVERRSIEMAGKKIGRASCRERVCQYV